MLPIEATVWKDRLPARTKRAKLQGWVRRSPGQASESLGRNFIPPSAEHAQFGGSQVEAALLCTFWGKFARYTVPEWLPCRSCRVETDGSGPKMNCGGVLQIPGFRVQMPSNVVRVPCPLHCCSGRGPHRHQLNMRFLLQQGACERWSGIYIIYEALPQVEENDAYEDGYLLLLPKKPDPEGYAKSGFNRASHHCELRRLYEEALRADLTGALLHSTLVALTFHFRFRLLCLSLRSLLTGLFTTRECRCRSFL